MENSEELIKVQVAPLREVGRLIVELIASEPRLAA
jgi:hypothetical protein